MTDCRQLLADYAQTRSEPAFRELVARYVDLVYSSALRLVDGDEHRARDVAQIVFADLAKKADELSPDVMLGGWLHRHTCFVASNTLRGERRRLAREREAVEMNSLHENDGVDFTRLAPLLDETINRLDEADRTAILLRFFEQKDFQAVGRTLDTSEDAARMRVNRALEKLRDLLGQRGIRTTSGALGIIITANAVQSAPIGLVATISAAAFAGTALTTSTIIAATTKTIAMTTLQKTLVAATVAVLAGAGIYEARQAAQLRNEVQNLQRRQADEIQQLQNNFAGATNRLADLLAENSRLKSDVQQAELLKLRGEVTRLQNAENDPAEKSAKAATAKVKLLKQYLELNPGRNIPELQFVTEKDWADVVWNRNLNTDDDNREALSYLRETAENTFLNEMMKSAFKKYLAANNDILPADLSRLTPYFDAPVTDDMLQRYRLLQTGKPDNSADLVKLAIYADADYDSNHGMSINGAWGSRFNQVSGAVQDAADAFAKDNNGQMPTQSSQITSYLKNPMDAVTVKKYLDQIAAGLRPNRGP